MLYASYSDLNSILQTTRTQHAPFMLARIVPRLIYLVSRAYRTPRRLSKLR